MTTLPYYSGALNEGVSMIVPLYADSQGHVWALYPSGKAGVSLYAHTYYASTDCTGQAYLFSLPARYVIAALEISGTGYGALKDNATPTVVQAQSEKFGGACGPVSMNAVPMFAITASNLDMNIPTVGASPYQYPLHPEYAP